MIDERQEELASLHALDLLEGAELAQFEAALARDPQLTALVRELREAAAALAHTSTAAPPAALRQRVLASIGETSAAPGNVIQAPASLFGNLVPWAMAAGFALLAAWVGQRNASISAGAALDRERQAMAEIEIKAGRQQLEAERIVVGRQLQETDQKVAGTTQQLADARQLLSERDRQIAERDRQIAESSSQLASRDQQLADTRAAVTARERQVATLTQRIDANAGASAEIGRQLGEAKDRVARLTAELKKQGELADLKITTLASMLKNSPQALAVAVWDAAKQEGVLKVEKLPALLATQDYQLWVVDPQYPNPVDGGVFTVDPQTGEARLTFKARQPVSAINAFAVTRERKGGVPKAEGPFVLLGK
ncbi:MAG: hypothetical protein EXS37_03525 [Opitutus sp.]|nr:hypothetical protein [Opitutus sp.]